MFMFNYLILLLKESRVRTRRAPVVIAPRERLCNHNHFNN